MQRIRVAALGVMVAAGLIGGVSVPASAAPSIAAAKNLCQAKGGFFLAPPVENFYSCTFAVGTFLSQENVTGPRRLCERAYGGSFFLTATNEYRCNDL